MSSALNRADAENLPHARGGGGALGKRTLGGKRALGGKRLGGAGGKGGKGGLRPRRALGDITNDGGGFGADAKPRRRRAVPRDAAGRVEDPEYLPVFGASPPRALFAPDLFAGEERPPPPLSAAAARRAALAAVNPGDLACEPAAKPPQSPGSAAGFDDPPGGLPLFSADELLPLDAFPDLVLLDGAL